MNDNIFVVTFNKNGQANTQYYSEEKYNTEVVPYLSKNYKAGEYNVSRLTGTTSENLDENGSYIVSVDENGSTKRKQFSGKDLLGGQLSSISQKYPNYRIHSVENIRTDDQRVADSIAQTQRSVQASIQATNDSVSRIQGMSDNLRTIKAPTMQDTMQRLINRDLYKPVYGADDNGNMTVTGYEMRTAEELKQYQEELQAEREQAKKDKADQEDLKRINAELAEVNKQLEEFKNYETVVNSRVYSLESIKWLTENSGKRPGLVSRRKELEEQQRNNPAYQSSFKAIDSQSADLLKEARSKFDIDEDGMAVPNVPEGNVWKATEHFAQQAQKTINAPDDTQNGFMSFLKGHGDTFTDSDFWAAGLNSLASNFAVKNIFDKIADKVNKDLSDVNLTRELDEGYFDTILTDAEKALILSFVSASQAQALRANNTNNMYNAGVTSANSIGFMAQFIMTGGVGDAFAAGVKGGVKKATGALAKWLTKKMGTKALNAAVNATVFAGTNVGKGLIQGANAIVTPVLKSVPMTFMQTGFGKDYSDKLVERDEHTGELKYDYQSAILPAYRDSFLEVWSESALAPVLEVFGKAMGVLGKDIFSGLGKAGAIGQYMTTKLDDLHTFLNSREAMKILTSAGYDGYLEEIGEEILAAGVSSIWDKKAWSQFWEKDNLVSMAVAFAPMSILGGGSSMINYIRRNNRYQETVPMVREIIDRYGLMSGEDLNMILNRDVNTLDDIGNKLRDVINPIAAMGSLSSEEFKAVYDFAVATSQNDVANAIVKRIDQDNINFMRNRIATQLGNKPFTSKDASGNETVAYYTDENGNKRYVIVDRTKADLDMCWSFDENGENGHIVSLNDIEVTEVEADKYFKGQLDEQKAALEKERIANETKTRNQQVIQNLRKNGPVMLLNPQTNEYEDYIYMRVEGDKFIMANRQTGENEVRDVQEIANALNMDEQVLTDAQKQQVLLDQIKANEIAASRANQFKGTELTLGGVTGTLLNTRVKTEEDGTSKLVAQIFTADNQIVPVAVTAQDINAFIEAGSTTVEETRKDKDQKRKQQQAEQSAAYKSVKEKYTNADGSVREAEFLERSPKEYAMYSDSKYGKRDTDATLRAALEKAKADVQASLAAKDSESNPDVKTELRKKYESAVNKLSMLDDLLSERTQDESSKGKLSPEEAKAKYEELIAKGLTDEDVMQLAANSIQETQQRIDALPAPAVSTDVETYLKDKEDYRKAVAEESKKIDYWKSIMAAPITDAEKVNERRANIRYAVNLERIQNEMKGAPLAKRIDLINEMKELAQGFIGESIKDLNLDGTSFVISTVDSIAQDMKDNNCSAHLIAKTLKGIARAQKLGQHVPGFYEPNSNKIFFVADNVSTMSEAKTTFVHEDQHRDTKENGLANWLLHKLNMDDDTARKFLLGELKKMNNTAFYDNADLPEIADEVISYAKESRFNGTIERAGVSEFIVNFVDNINNERNESRDYKASSSASRGAGYGNDLAGINNQENGRGPLPESGAVAGQGTGSAGGDLRGLEDLQKLSAIAFDGEGGELTTPEGELIAEGNGNGEVMFSVRTYDKPWKEGELSGRELYQRFLAKQVEEGVLTQKDAEDMAFQLERAYQICQEMNGKKDENGDPLYKPFGNWSQAEVTVDEDGKPYLSVITPNSDYVRNIDFSRVCKKRRALDAVLNRMLNDGTLERLETLRETDIALINWILQDNAEEVACALCFVDARRYNVGNMAELFAKQYNSIISARLLSGTGLTLDNLDFFNFSGAELPAVENSISSMTPEEAASILNWGALKSLIDSTGKKTVGNKIAQLLWNDMFDKSGNLKKNATIKHLKKLSHGDLVSSDSFEGVKAQDEAIMKLYNAQKGAGGPKASYKDMQYLNDIEVDKNFSNANIDKVYDEGGVRVQSFSDYVPRMVFDYLQMIADLSARKFPAHAYTKEELFVKTFGLTGLKINMSLVPDVVKDGVAPGLDAEGNYVWCGEIRDAEGNVVRPSQTFDYDTAMEIQAADRYSRNCGTIAVGISDAHIEKMLNDNNIRMVIPYHKSSLNPIVAVMNNVDQFVDYTDHQTEKWLEPDKHRKKDGKLAKTPHFSFNAAMKRLGDPKAAIAEYFKWCAEKGLYPKFRQFASHPNYYKLIEDFNVYDCKTNEYASHQPVTMTFPTEKDAFGSLTDLIKRGLEEDTAIEATRDAKMDAVTDLVEKSIEYNQAARRERFAQYEAEGIKVYDENGKLTDKVKEREKEFGKQLAAGRKPGEYRTMFRTIDITPEVRDEMAQIEAQARLDGSYMKAPNGADSKLTEEQWSMVRTQNFKNWFGDWENDPENASKVVDENGEPMVVYHGTKWNPYEEGPGNAEFKAGWFTSIKSRAEGFGEPVSVFINIRKPAYSAEVNATEGFDLNDPKTFGEYDGYLNEENYPANPQLSEGAKRVIKMRNPNNYEEALARAEASMTRGKQFFSIIPADPNQIKSATDNTGEFSTENNDIRFAVATTKDRKANESASDFYRRVMNDYASSMKLLVPTFMYPKRADNAVGGYDKNSKRIIIFTDENESNYIEAERQFLHENSHAALDMMAPEVKDNLINGYLAAADNFGPEYVGIIDNVRDVVVSEGYAPEEVEEEVFVRMINPLLAKGNVQDALDKVSDESVVGLFDEFLNTLNYDKERQRDIRRSLWNDQRRVSGGLQETEVSNGQAGRTSTDPDGNRSPRFKVENQNQEIFVSNAAKAVESINTAKATPAQWFGMINSKGGLKAGEDKWLGLSDWLNSSDKKTLTKQEVLDFINENKIQIEEVRYVDNADLIMDEKYPGFSDAFETDPYMGGLVVNNMSKALKLYEEFGDGSIDVDDMDLSDLVDFGESLMSKDFKEKQINDTRRDYTTEGLENKREIALTVPTIEPYNQADNIHFGDAGEGRAVAWIRFGETRIDNASELNSFWERLGQKYGKTNGILMTDEESAEYNRLMGDAQTSGNRVLVIDEIQSKRHQDGREKGYATEESIGERRSVYEAALAEKNAYMQKMADKYTDGRISPRHWVVWMDSDEKAEYRRLEDATARARRRAANTEDRLVPDAPFEKNWHELAFKRMLRLAAEEGYDKIAWTNGAMQAERYGISRAVNGFDRYNDTYYAHFTTGGDLAFYIKDGAMYGKGEELIPELEGQQLSEVFGSSVANRIMDLGHEESISLDELKAIGGEGMKGFYDNILVKFANKYGKKWGSKVEDITLPGLQNEEGWHSMDITPEMKESVMNGQVMFRAVDKVQEDFAPRFAEIRNEYTQKRTEIVGHEGRFTPEEFRAHRDELLQAGKERDAKLEALNKEYIKAYEAAEEEDRNNAPVYDKVVDADPERGNTLFAAAKEEFGTTTDFNEAGYVLPDGDMIDLSGKNNGGEPGRRQNDHRDIGSVISDRKYETATEYMEDFINEGAIRIAPETGLITVAQKPTEQQIDRLRDYIYKHNGEVELEIYDKSRSVADAYYRYRTAPSRILSDIKDYYANGAVPQGNQPLFRTSNVAYDMSEQGTRFSVRTKPAPAETKPVWKLMRLGEDGLLYPLYIDRNTQGLELGKWYDADSPEIKDLKNLEAGYSYLIDKEGNVVDKIAGLEGQATSIKGNKPSKDQIKEAAANGMRWIAVTNYANGNKCFSNLGISGSTKTKNGEGGVSAFAMRPGWHAGSLPSMKQIAGRSDDMVWVKSQIAYGNGAVEEAAANGGEINDHIPYDGGYSKATSSFNEKNVDWYISGAFMPEEIMSDADARQAIDDWNRENNANVPYDVERPGGKLFNAKTMKMEDSSNVRFAVSEVNNIRSAKMGMSLSSEESGMLMDALEVLSDKLPAEIPFTKENYDALFSNGVDTPMGHVKMGENQFDKFSVLNRKYQLAMASNTLKSPDFITEKDSKAKDDQETERASSYIYGKVFNDGDTKYVYYNSVSVLKDGLEVVISNYAPERKRLERELREGKLAYIKEVTLPSESSTSAQGDQNTSPAGGISKGKDTNSSEKSNTPFRVTPEQDAEFRKAYEEGNEQKAIELISDAFKAAYPNNKLGARSFYKGKNGEWENQIAGYFTDDFEFANHYGSGDVKECFLVMENPYEYDFKESGSDGDFEGTDGEIRNTRSVMEEADKEAKEKGLKPYDGYILRNVGEGYGPGSYVVDDYIVKDPKQVKSADPFTFDDNGELIPLSQRFNPKSDDIRFSVAYHGSGAEFNEFDSSMMGTGEGAQAHGWGTYVTFDEDMAKAYANKNVIWKMLKGGELKHNGQSIEWRWLKELNDWNNDLKDIDLDSIIAEGYRWAVSKSPKDNEPTPENVLKAMWNVYDGMEVRDYAGADRVLEAYNYYWQHKDEYSLDLNGKRNLYTVNIPRDNGKNYIVEEEPVRKSLVLKVNNALMKIPSAVNLLERNNVKDFVELLSDQIGRDFYTNLTILLGTEDMPRNPEAASKLLKSLGIDGIKYEGRVDGPCAVLFQDSDVEITDHVRFKIGPVAEMKQKGMEAVLGDNIVNFTNHMLTDVLSEDQRNALYDEALENGGDYTMPILGMLADIAVKDTLSAEDESIVEQARESLKNILGVDDEKLTQNDLLWIAYNDYHRHDPTIQERVNTQSVKRDLEQSSPVAGTMTLEEYLEAAAKSKDDLQAQYEAMRAIAKEMDNIYRAMGARANYDRATVGKIVDLANALLESKLMDSMTNGEVKRLMGILRRTTAMKNIQSRTSELYNLILSNHLRNLKNMFEKELKKKGTKVNSSNVVEQSALDLEGQTIMDAFKKYMTEMTRNADGSYTVSQEFLDKYQEIADKFAEADQDSEGHKLGLQLWGMSLAKNYIEKVVANEKEEESIRDAMKDAEEQHKAGKMDDKVYRDFMKEHRKALVEVRSERVKDFGEIVQKLRDITAASHTMALDFLENDKARIQQIHHEANSDLEGQPGNEHPRKATFWQNVSNLPFVQFFFRPLATFDQMLRLFGSKSVNGEGYLWNRYMRGWIDATGKEYKAVQSAFETLDKKVSDVFGKQMKWSDLYQVEKTMPNATVSFFDDGVMVEHELTQGNLLYILLADRMTDGRMKLRAMGITEEDVEAIRNQMDKRFLELADWVVDEFLPSRREAYNEVHERMFGASMAKVDNYFPLKVLSNARTQQVDVASANTDPSTPSTVTGSIMKRTRNSLALDIMSTDAFSEVIDHVQKMEHWAAFAEWNRDLSDLLSYRKFRNRVQNMTSIYGSQRNLWTEFVDTAMIAAGSYRGKSGKLDPFFNRMAKGVTAAKISLRVFTAIKQFLSFPAYFSEANPIYLAQGFAKGWNWSMDNLPMFEKRWKSRQAGDHILAEGNLGRINEAVARVGMFPNALVDAFTVSIGSYAIYRTKYDKYKKMGFSDAAADKKAKQDAVILYNETQQSSELAFMSSMQSGRTTLEKMFTVFRNSSMGYQRQVHDALRNTKRRWTEKDYKKKSIEFMTKQLVREGLEDTKALAAAQSLYNRQIVKDGLRLAIFGYGLQFFWNLAPYLPYLLFGDDDDKKKEMLGDVAGKAIFGSLEGLTGGNIMSEAANLVATGESLSDYDPTLLPLVSDFKALYQEFGKDNVRAFNDLVNLGIQMGIGLNPQTLEDAIVAIVDACQGDLGTATEAMFLGLRLINAPQSSLDQLYIDELDMNALEAKNMTIPELAKRYAEYKKRKGAGLLSPLYSLNEELDSKVMEKYTKSITEKAKDRFGYNDIDRRFEQLTKDSKEMSDKVKDLRSAAKKGDESANEELLKIMMSPDYGRYIRFENISQDYKDAVKSAIESETVETMVGFFDQANKIKGEIYEEFSRPDGSMSYFKDLYAQYTEGIIPMMAKLDKQYSDQLAKENPKYAEWLKKHQDDINNAADNAKTNSDRIAEIDKELESLTINLPNGKKRYINPYRRKQLNEEKKQLKEIGATPATYLRKLKKDEEFKAEDYMPAEILETPEWKVYSTLKEEGSVSGNRFKFDDVKKWEQDMKESEDPETKAKFRDMISNKEIVMGQMINKILNGFDEDDEILLDF